MLRGSSHSPCEVHRVARRRSSSFVGNQDPVLDEIERFINSRGLYSVNDRVLATVLSAFIDKRPEQLTAEVFTYYKTFIERWRGHITEMGEEGFLASFDGPARAIRAACKLRDISKRLELASVLDF